MKNLKNLKQINGKAKQSKCILADYPNGEHEYILIKGKKICKSCGESQ